MLLADRTERDWRLESDSSRELRTASERVVTFDSARGIGGYRTQGSFVRFVMRCC